MVVEERNHFSYNVGVNLRRSSSRKVPYLFSIEGDDSGNFRRTCSSRGARNPITIRSPLEN